ncbi:SDR family oxidoreductase [Zhouia sp. PK063]|uniref:SDR family oxidoreductase n=1 Tax=Zhouia sp. PK063 TaxID=3373602 RepID=UPI003798D817
MIFDVRDKVAVVTGGNGSLGGAIAMGFAKAGMKVAILGRTQATVNEKVAAIEKEGGKAFALYADVLDRTEIETAASELLAHWGKLDVLVNAAGGNRAGATITPDQTFFDASLEDIEKVNNLNFMGTVIPTMEFGKLFLKNKDRQGSVIHISSMAADRALTRVMGYSASKSAVTNFTKWLAVEFAQKYGEHLRVNAIAPGFFLGEQNRTLLTHADGSYTSRAQQIIHSTPMQRFGEAEELVGTAIWLASKASSFVTGAVIPVDGGFSAFSGV